jgi:hypothetical protein
MTASDESDLDPSMTDKPRPVRPAPAHAAAPKPTGSERPFECRPFNGASALHRNGKPLPGLFLDLAPDSPPSAIADAATAGVHLYRLLDVGLGWNGMGQFNYAALEARLQALFAADTQAVFLLEVAVDAPRWWLAAHPEERAVYCEQEGTDPVVSWASRRWMTEAGNALARLVRFLSLSAYGRACIGYQLGAGMQGEWRLPFAQNLPDIGPKMTEAFRTYAREKYRRNAGLLKKAWGDTRPDFDLITCPNAWERSKGDYGIFRSPERSRRVGDYHECFADTQNRAALHFCTTVKRASEGLALTGLAYATVPNIAAIPEDGHVYPESVLESPDVDFFVAPGLRADPLLLRTVTGSIRLREKFLLVSPASGSSPDVAIALAATQEAGLCLPVQTPPEALKLALRVATEALRAPSKLRKRASQVAVVVDLAAACHLAGGKTAPTPLFNSMLTELFRELNRLGVPYDVYQLGDLFQPKFPDHKVTIFPNMFTLTEAERRRVDARVKRSEQTGIWFYAPGLLGEGGADAGNVQSLTGMKTRLELEETNLRVRIAVSDDPLTWGYHAGSHFGMEKAFSPTVTLADKHLTRLGANSNNKTTFAVFRFPQWNSIVFGVFPVPRTLLRNALRAAGVHLYLDTGDADTAVLADSRTLALHSAKAGAYTLSLPGSFLVKEARTGKTIAPAATEIMTTLTAGGTAVYELTPLKARRTEEARPTP